MFTWICPQCGREVPPSYTECPDCAEKLKAAAEATPAQIATPVPTSAPAKPAPPEPARTQPPPPAPRQGLPGWLVSILFALCFIALAVSFLTYFQSRKSKPSEPDAASASAVPAAKQASITSSVSRFVEITGFRVTEDEKQKAKVEFVAVNHSGADIADLAGTVTLKASASNSAAEPVAVFDFKLKSLAPYEAKDLKLPIQTKLRAYELPDWQFLKADVQITSPQ